MFEKFTRLKLFSKKILDFGFFEKKNIRSLQLIPGSNHFRAVANDLTHLFQ